MCQWITIFSYYFILFYYRDNGKENGMKIQDRVLRIIQNILETNIMIASILVHFFNFPIDCSLSMECNLVKETATKCCQISFGIFSTPILRTQVCMKLKLKYGVNCKEFCLVDLAVLPMSLDQLWMVSVNEIIYVLIIEFTVTGQFYIIFLNIYRNQ